MCVCTRVGFDGGQRQWFRIEITDQKSGILIANLSSTQPAFAVNGLDSERLLKIAVMAVNSKGASDRVILDAYTLKAPEKRLGKSTFTNIYIGITAKFIRQNYKITFSSSVNSVLYGYPLQSYSYTKRADSNIHCAREYSK